MPKKKAAAAAAKPVAGRWIAFAVLLGAGFMNLLDITIVNVALPSLQLAFDATSSQIEWVVAAYILVFALGLLPAGRLGDIYGRRAMFMAGVTVFTIGSALCGLATSIETLVASRVLQAVGAAMMTPQTLAFVPALFAPKEQGVAYALGGLAAGLASVIGPVMGGTLIGLDIWGLGWRPIFLVNLPFGILAIVMALKYVPKLQPKAIGGNDFVGIVLAGIALLLVIFPLIEGRQVGWPWWCFAMMAAAVPMAAVFVGWQHRQAARGAAQLLPVALLANRKFLIGTALAALTFSGIPSFFLVFAIYLQSGFGLTPLQSGLTTVPFSVGVLVASIAAGKLGMRRQRLRITIGALLLMTGMSVARTVVLGTEDAVVWAWFAVPLFIAGLGLGTAISPLFQTILSSVAGRDAGSASGALQSFQQVGGALGVAIMGEIFFSTLMRAGAGAASHAVYADALRNALIYNLFAYAVIAAAVWLLPRPGKQAVGAVPVPSE
jgi:EmrB/QacA subfamily drug resistance transporter